MMSIEISLIAINIITVLYVFVFPFITLLTYTTYVV